MKTVAEYIDSYKERYGVITITNFSEIVVNVVGLVSTWTDGVNDETFKLSVCDSSDNIIEEFEDITFDDIVVTMLYYCVEFPKNNISTKVSLYRIMEDGHNVRLGALDIV